MGNGICKDRVIQSIHYFKRRKILHIQASYSIKKPPGIRGGGPKSPWK